jgi:hypothetical protein
MSKSPIGFIASWPKQIIRPSEQPQYQGGDLIVIGSGPVLPIESADEDDKETEAEAVLNPDGR